jgi:hypothetical protein
MQKLNTRHGYVTIARVLRFLELRLARFPELASYREVVAALRRRLNEDHGAFGETLEQRISATAEIAVLDAELDAGVITVGQTAFLMFDRDREHPMYKLLFPMAPSKMVAEVGGERQERFVHTLLQTIAANEAYLSLRDRATELSRILDQLRQAQARRKELFVAEATARAKYELTADDARREYNQLYHQFMVALPGRGREVETLFYPLASTARTAPAEPAGPAEDPQDA